MALQFKFDSVLQSATQEEVYQVGRSVPGLVLCTRCGAIYSCGRFSAANQAWCCVLHCLRLR